MDAEPKLNSNCSTIPVWLLVVLVDVSILNIQGPQCTCQWIGICTEDKISVRYSCILSTCMIRIHIHNLYMYATITCKHKLQITLLRHQPQPLQGNRSSKNIKEILQTKWSLGSTPHPITVTTRIIKLLVRNPNLKIHLPLLLGGGLDPNDHLGYPGSLQPWQKEGLPRAFSGCL